MLWRFILFSVAVGGYTYLRMVHPLAWRRRWKITLGIAVTLAAVRFPVLAVVYSDNPLAPECPQWFNLLYSWLFLTLLICFCGAFAGHFVRRCILPRVAKWRALPEEVRQGVFNRLHLGLLAAAMSTSALGTWEGLREPRIREVTIPCAVREPLRIALLTDLHESMLRPDGQLQSIVERTNALKPDIIAITGDFVDGHITQCSERMQALRGLRAPLGVYGVAGNHDYYSGYTEWRDFLNSIGVRMLDNAHVILPGGRAVIAGITEETAEKTPGMEPPSIDKALDGTPEGVPIILLSHRPGTVDEAARRGVALQLSGHTHGGLVWGVGQLISLMNNGYLKGLYKEGDTWLYVSPGTRCGARTPLRIGVPAEITLIRLTNGKP